jgi:DNA-binding response OmpR family regulator
MEKTKVVVVDDDPMIRFLVQEYLAAAGFEVQAFARGAEMLETLASSQPDLVILDLQMPEMNGLEVLEKIRSSPETSSVPVLMLSANTRDAQGASAPTADQYLEKPFQMQDFLEAVQSTKRAQ